MGKASRGKRERSREKSGQWTASGGARAAHRARQESLRLLQGNPWVRAMLTARARQLDLAQWLLCRVVRPSVLGA